MHLGSLYVGKDVACITSWEAMGDNDEEDGKRKPNKALHHPKYNCS